MRHCGGALAPFTASTLARLQGMPAKTAGPASLPRFPKVMKSAPAFFCLFDGTSANLRFVQPKLEAFHTFRFQRPAFFGTLVLFYPSILMTIHS